MPDFGSPVVNAGSAYDPGKGIATISELMGLQQKKIAIDQAQQTLQTNAYVQQQHQAAAQADQQSMQERQLLQTSLKNGKDPDGNALVGDDGEADPVAMTRFATKYMPLTGQGVVQNIVKTASDKFNLQSTGLRLDQQQRQMLQGPLQALNVDPSDDNISNVRTTFGQMLEAHPEMGKNVAAANALLDHVAASKDPKQRAHLANSFSALLQPGTAVATQPQAATLNDNQTISQGVVAPPEAGGGYQPSTKTQVQLPPTTTVLDTKGNPVAYGSGKLTPGQPGPALGMNLLGAQLQTNAADTVKGAKENASTYQNSQFNNNQIIRLALDPKTTTGTGSDLLSKLGGGFAALPWTSDMSSNYDNLGHYMGQQAITQMKAAGLAGTDADKALAQSVTGDRHYTRDAVVDIARTNRALSEGGRLFNEGVQDAAKTGDPQAVNDFQQKWQSAATVDGFRIYNARRNKDQDPEGFSNTVKNLGGVNSPRYKAAIKSVDDMAALINGAGRAR